jgi:hypothetical protein
MAEVVPEPGRRSAAYRPGGTGGRFQFGLSSILLVVTFFAIICSIIKMSPGLGIVIAILALPALVRTCVVVLRHNAEGDPLSVRKKVVVFVLTLCMILLVAVAVICALVVAFTAICGSMVPRDPDFGWTLLFGAIGLTIAPLLAWLLWKRLRGK